METPVSSSSIAESQRNRSENSTFRGRPARPNEGGGLILKGVQCCLVAEMLHHEEAAEGDLCLSVQMFARPDIR